jgi:CubicO group peptidase (beta-lactamase class C family)
MVLVRCVLLVVVAAVAVAGCGGSDGDELAKSPKPQKAADAATSRKLQEVLDFQRESDGATGMAAAIVIRGRHLWSGGSSLSNRETKAPVTADTPFPILSITKMFVGALALKLAEQGRLKLDDLLSRALPGWPRSGQGPDRDRGGVVPLRRWPRVRDRRRARTAKEITVAALSSGDADLRLLTTSLTEAALETD